MLLLLQPLLLLVWSFVVSFILWMISWFSDSRDDKETLFTINGSIIIHYSHVLFCYLYLVGSQEPLETASCPDLVLQPLVTRMTTRCDGQEKSLFLAGWCYAGTHRGETKVHSSRAALDQLYVNSECSTCLARPILILCSVGPHRAEARREQAKDP